MPIIKKEIRIELTGADAEEIITDYISAKMKEYGYMLTYIRKENGDFWPDTFWRGEEE